MTLLKTVQSAALVHLKMQNKRPKIFIIAGEVSGDVLGSRIMAEMPDADFIGIGGENMSAVGLRPLFPMSDLAVMGVAEVVAHARTLTRRIRQTADEIIKTQPDIVLTIDSPGFARGVIKRVRKSAAGRNLIAKGLRFHHVVAPQVWAWGARRAKKYAKTFDKLYAFFDFERPYFTKYGLDTVAVGHPIADTLIGQQTTQKKSEPDKIITLIPGSRMSEVRRLLPLMQGVAEMLQRCGYLGYKFIIPTVETTADYIKAQIKNWTVDVELVPAASRYEVYKKTYIAIAASGTVSAELAMMHIPAIIVYKMNPITIWLVRRVIKIRWVSLVNILTGHGIYPEFLGPMATPENIVNAFCELAIPSVREKMITELQAADKLWQPGNGAAAHQIAESVRRTANPAS